MCYLSLALPVVAEAPVIIAEVVIVAIAVFVEVYIVYDKDWPVEEVVFFNRVAEDTSGAPDALREVRTTQLLERCRPLSYPDNLTEAIIEVTLSKSFSFRSTRFVRALLTYRLRRQHFVPKRYIVATLQSTVDVVWVAKVCVIHLLRGRSSPTAICLSPFMPS